jgi:hypothetical protein
MMALSFWEILELADAPRNPGGELRLVWRLIQHEHMLAAAVAASAAVRPAFALSA